MQKRSYIGGIFWGVKTLCVGLKTTMRELFTKKITEQYPRTAMNSRCLTVFAVVSPCHIMKTTNISAWRATFVRWLVPMVRYK